MKSRSAILGLIAAIAIAIPAAGTNGYFSHGQGTANKALGGAGVALPQDALAGVTNPAGVVDAPEGMLFSVALFNPNRSYTITGMPTGYPGTFPLAPGRVESESEIFLMPSLAANWRLGDRLAFSLAGVAHGGMNTDYRTNTFWGGDHTGVDLAQMFIDATLGWKMTPRQSVGITATAAYQRFEAQGLQAFAPMTTGPGRLTNNEHDHSYGFGFKVGYLARVLPNLSVGAAWSPKISMSKFDDYSGLFSNGGNFDIPSSQTAGLAWTATEAMTVVADVQRIHFSDIHSVGHPLMPNLMNGLGALEGPGFGWKDVTAYKAGVQYALSPAWTLRAGYSTAEQPIPESEVLFNIL
ncbi:MAG TPA: TonB-dependent receptor, partial [Thermoanaerobaculia bacterium]|nr:TonB-dependent receptor [Thermoanaerobaculia bacterium]